MAFVYFFVSLFKCYYGVTFANKKNLEAFICARVNVGMHKSLLHEYGKLGAKLNMSSGKYLCPHVLKCHQISNIYVKFC